MKKSKLFVLAIIVVLSAIILCSCKTGTGNGKYDFGNEGDTEILSDLKEYHVIRGDLCTDTEKEALVKFRETVMKNLGITLVAVTDWIGEGQQEQEKEILIGKTNREESISAMEGLGYHDFVIRLDGTKLVIAGGSGTATMEAVDYFISNYIDVLRSTFSYPKGNGYRYVRTYTVDSLTIDGTDISEYRLYSTDSDVDISDVQAALSDSLVGVRLEIDEEPKTNQKYIVFDNSSMKVDSYSVSLDENGNLIVSGSYKTFEKAKEYFKKAFFEELASSQGKKPNFTNAENVTKELSVNKPYTKYELISKLDSLSGKNSIAVGETLHGSQSMPSYTFEVYREATGKNPAVIGVDLGERGLQLSELSSVDWSRAICEVTDFARSGGIVSVMVGLENPSGKWELSGGKSSGTLGGDKEWNELFTEGTELNLKLREELSNCAVFFEALADNGVNVLWSPISDRNASSCWYAPTQGNEEHIKKLWIYIYRFFETLGIDNLVWVYTPSLTRSTASAIASYPGNEYTDYIGGNIMVKTKSDFETALSTYSALLGKTEKKSAIIRFGLLSDGTLIADTKEAQASLFGSANLLSEVRKLYAKGSFSLLITDYGTSSLEWLGDGVGFVSEKDIITLDNIDE